TVAGGATGNITNTATVTVPAGVLDPNSGNNTATDVDSVTPTADLQISKTDGLSSVKPGQSIAYTIVVTNAGPSAVTGATVADPLPNGLTGATWTCAASPGSSCGAPTGSGSINTTVNLLSGGAATFSL